MPFALRNQVRLYWCMEGLPDKPALLLLNSIGTDIRVWDRAIPFLLPAFRVVRMDTRGHGASDVVQGDYSLTVMAEDAAAVLDAAGIERVIVAGLSLGGMIAMELALRMPSRVTALALICTSAAMDRALWQERIALVSNNGMSAIGDLAINRFLSPDFAANNPAITASLRACLMSMTKAGYIGAAAAVRDMSLLNRIANITVPTLVISGRRDVATPFVGHGARIVAEVPGAVAREIDCGHLAPVEAPSALTSALRDFADNKTDIEHAAATLFEAGLRNRRRILGDAWVEKSLAGRTAFNSEFQELITRIAWQGIWDRPGLDDRTRRLLVLAVTAALGRWEEFRLHVRAGLERSGFTMDELKEVLLQLSIYAGVPCANTAFAEAEPIVDAFRLKSNSS